MTLTESSIRVTWAPDTEGERVLVEHGDPMWDEVQLDGGQDIEEQALYRAAGIIAQPRGNERHTLRFTLAAETSGPAEALATALTAATSWPRGRADVLLETTTGAKYLLRNAACRSWGGGPGEEHVARAGLELVGGELVSVPVDEEEE